MVNTSQFNLPLLSAAQAQKHVTVNEALTMLDAFAQLRLFSITVTSPPSTPSEGAAYFAPDTATGEWQPLSEKIVIYSNGGWIGVDPKTGWQAWVEDAAASYVFSNGAWREKDGVLADNGAATQNQIFTGSHVVSPGSDNTTNVIIPAHSVVYCVSARVSAEIVMDATSSWSLGVGGAVDRYGTQYGSALNSYALGLTGQPTAYYVDTPLVITGETADFVSGTIEFAVHAKTFSPPDMV